MLTEVYGFRTVVGVIWLGFACNPLVVLLLWLGGLIPSVVFWENQEAYNAILGQLPWILLGCFGAYLAGEFSNSANLALLKIRTQGRFLWMRSIGSSIVGQGLDSLVFIFIAFGAGGDLPVQAPFRLALFQWWAKIAYEALATPLTCVMVTYLKGKEQMDVYNAPRSLNP